MAEGDRPLVDPAFRGDVLAGLATRPRAIPARWLYDQRGSELFDQITRLPEYYPTRVETEILARSANEIGALIGRGGAVVEFGAGSSTKTPMILSVIDPQIYVPIDISGEYLAASASRLGQSFPDVTITPVVADFLNELTLPEHCADLPMLGFFPGSTIGNMVPQTAVRLLANMAKVLGVGAKLLIGMDRIKSPDILIPAYDDMPGITAAFNLNLLVRINTELGGNIPVDQFVHEAVWNDAFARIEMHLRARNDVVFTVAGKEFSMLRGETIHTENSHKYGARDAALLLRSGGWEPIAEWTDDQDQFALILAELQPARYAP